jgi:hypothetical protein
MVNSSDQGQSEYHAKNRNNSPAPANKLFIALIALLIVAGGSFYGGTAYEKSHDKSTTPGSSSLTGFRGRAGGGRTGGFSMGTFGTVTAVSPTSISVQNPRSGSSNSYTINSSTVVSDNGSSSSVSDIATGDTVVIRTASTTSTVATQIDLNPSFGGGAGGTQSGTGSSSST